MSEHSPWWYQPPEKTRRQRIRERLTAKVSAIILICILVGTITVIAVQDYIKMIQQTGQIKTKGLVVYWFQNCSDPVNFIDWGDLTPGQTYSLTTWVRNEGDYSIKINHTTDMPKENQNITLTLVYDKTLSLAPGKNTSIVWILWVNGSATEQLLLPWNTTIYGYDLQG